MNITTERSEKSGIWRAECPDLPGMSPAGIGMTEAEAVAILFLRIRSGWDRTDWWRHINPNFLVVNGRTWQDPYWLQEHGEPLTPEPEADIVGPMREQAELLTETERKIVKLLGEANDLFDEVIKDGSRKSIDQQRWDSYMMGAQEMILSQAASRAYSDYVLLGESN